MSMGLVPVLADRFVVVEHFGNSDDDGRPELRVHGPFGSALAADAFRQGLEQEDPMCDYWVADIFHPLHHTYDD